MLTHYPDIDTTLLTSHRTHHAMVEFTRACNLRCTYCAVSQPNWNHLTLDFDQIDFDELVSSLKARNLKVVVLHGHGETTIIEGWHKYALKFKDAGIGLTTCTNLSHDYTEEELDVLSDFVGITVSLDTIDPVLFRQLRRGGNLAKVLHNQGDIWARAKAKHRDIHWTWSCVIVDKTISGLIDLVRQGITMGVRVFCFCNLTELPTPEGGVDLRHLSKLSHPEAVEALRIMEEARRICIESNVVFDAKAGLMDTLRQRVHG